MEDALSNMKRIGLKTGHDFFKLEQEQSKDMKTYMNKSRTRKTSNDNSTLEKSGPLQHLMDSHEKFVDYPAGCKQSFHSIKSKEGGASKSPKLHNLGIKNINHDTQPTLQENPTLQEYMKEFDEKYDQ